MGQISSAPHLRIWWEVVSFNLNMKFFAIICCVGLAQANVVKRDSFGHGYGGHGVLAGGISPAAVSEPVCESVPRKVCNDRSVETPRQVCHTEHDEIIDTTITEHCEERITTKCEQVSSQTRHASRVVGADSKVLATGIVASGEVTVAHGASVATGGVISGYGAGAAAGAVGGIVGAGGIIGAGASLGYTSGYASGYGYNGLAHAHTGYAKRDADGFHGGIAYANGGAGPVNTGAPICHSIPVRTCNQVPVNTPRKVAKTVCKTVVDVKIIKDCTDTIHTTCTQQSVQQSHSSGVVGSHSKTGPSAVVANHGTVSQGASYTGAAVGGVVGGAIGVIGGYTGGVAVGVASPVISSYSGSSLIGAVAAPVAVASAPLAAAAPVAVAAAPLTVAAPVAVAAAPLAVATVGVTGCVNTHGASFPCN